MSAPTQAPTPGGPGIGVLGLGFMGRVHLAAWQRAAQEGHPCRVVAVCDRDADRRAGRTSGGGNLSSGELLFDPTTLHAHESAEELFADESVQVVSITTPTDTHVPLALAALAAGKHVLVEKPVALTSAEVARLGAAARESDRLVMPALCIRFWPGWSWLKQAITQGGYGALQSLSLWRLSARPDWNDAFYRDPTRSGGALFDLHLHDTDLVRWCLGEPDGVSTRGHSDHVSTHYHYEAGPAHVLAEGGWNHAPGFPFTMGYRALFEDATAEYEFRREQPLLLCRDGQAAPVPLPDLTGYDVQCRALLDALSAGASRPPVTLGEAYATTRLLEREARSCAAGGLLS